MKNNAQTTKTTHPKIILTGDRPTGQLHHGHYVGSLQNRVALQNRGGYEHAYYMIADVQALTDNFDNPEKVRKNVREVALDNMACGVDPEKTTFFIQSQIAEIAELTMFFMNLVTVSRLFQNPTVKSEALQKFSEIDFLENDELLFKQANDIFRNLNEGDFNSMQDGRKKYTLLMANSFVKSRSQTNIPAGFLCYPVSQAADILTFKANTIPVGDDQKPMIEQTNELGHKFNTLYSAKDAHGEELFPYVNIVTSEYGRLVGIDGNAKMSKSLGNCIYIADSDEMIAKKVMQMYTDPMHIRVEDPGNVEGNVVFMYLDIFDENKAEVAELKAQYKKGGLGDVVLKKRLIKILCDHFAPIRARREELAAREGGEYVYRVLREGTERAREEARKTLKEVKAAMKIDYFTN
jgi:tryptophanyl-tRNA synthetase